MPDGVDNVVQYDKERGEMITKESTVWMFSELQHLRFQASWANSICWGGLWNGQKLWDKRGCVGVEIGSSNKYSKRFKCLFFCFPVLVHLSVSPQVSKKGDQGLLHTLIRVYLTWSHFWAFNRTKMEVYYEVYLEAALPDLSWVGVSTWVTLPESLQQMWQVKISMTVWVTTVMKISPKSLQPSRNALDSSCNSFVGSTAGSGGGRIHIITVLIRHCKNTPLQVNCRLNVT